MSAENSDVACPICEYTNRSDANFCGNCGRPLSSTQPCMRCGSDNLRGRLFCDACGASLTAAPTPTPDPQLDERVSRSSSSATGNVLGRRVTWLRERVVKGVWPPFIWTGSPVLFVAILLVAVAKDSFGWRLGEALLKQQEGYGDVTSEGVTILDPALSGDALNSALLLNQVALLPGLEKTADFETVSNSFHRPRGITAANGMLYVVDPSQGALFVLDADGEEISQVLNSNRPFVEPVDVAADAAGNIYVLDAGDGGQVSIHSPTGEFMRVVPLADNTADRSRGLDVDNQGRIWLAMTPALAVAAFNADGQELIRISTNYVDMELQPVDVAFHSDDSVYVSSVGMTSVIRFSLEGEPLTLWPLVNANSVDGPHLSLDTGGVLYVSQPEQGGYLRISGDSVEELESWIIRPSQSIPKLVGISADMDGNLVVTDSGNGNIYRIPFAP